MMLRVNAASPTVSTVFVNAIFHTPFGELDQKAAFLIELKVLDAEAEADAIVGVRIRIAVTTIRPDIGEIVSIHNAAQEPICFTR